MLYIDNSDLGMFSVSVYRDQVAIAWRLSQSQVPEVRRFRKSQPDFEWTHIYLSISDNNIRGMQSLWFSLM